MFTPTLLFRFRLVFFTIASMLNIILAILLMHQTVAHADICWWLFFLETFGLSYYSLVEFGLDRFSEGRLSILGIIGSAVATQGVLSNSVDSPVSRILMLLAGCNLGFIFSIGLRIKPNRTAVSSNNSMNNKLETSNDAFPEITPEEAPVVNSCEVDLEYSSESSDSSSDLSMASDAVRCYISRESVSVVMGVIGLSLGAVGWVLNFSGWIKECLDKDTCSDLAPQWWSLGQSLMFFVMYLLATLLSRSFEVLAAYSILVSIPVSVSIRVANAARSDFFYLKNQEQAYETWDSLGTVIGSSLIAVAGVLLVISLGILHYSWKSPAPKHTRSFRAILSLFGILGVVIFGIGLQYSQKEACDRNDPVCDWYDGLWVDISLEIVIVIFGILTVFSQPGESIRGMLVALTVVPSYAYIINISRFLSHWISHDDLQSDDDRWEIRFSAIGLVMLSVCNYFWILGWGWGKSECSDRPPHALSGNSGMTKTLLNTVSSFTTRSRRLTPALEVEELEMGQMKG